MKNEYTVKNIIAGRLQSLGCDGLANRDDACGCGINDLAPCGGCCMGCVPARSVATPNGIEWHAVGFEKKQKNEDKK